MPRLASKQPAFIRSFLLSVVSAYLFFVEPHSRDRIPSRPKILACVVALFALQSRYRYRTLSFKKADHRRHLILGRYLDALLHVISHQVSFDDSTFFLPCQFVKYASELATKFPIKHIAASFGNKDNLILAIPLRVGQALI